MPINKNRKDAKYRRGDEVYWVDPDDDLCSGWYVIEEVLRVRPHDESIYRLSSGAEVFEFEIRESWE